MFVVFARTLPRQNQPDTILYLWGIPRRSRKVSLCKLLCYGQNAQGEYTYAIAPQGGGYIWQVDARTGKSATFAEAWRQMPHFVRHANQYRESPWVAVPHCGIPTLYWLWLAQRVEARKALAAAVPGTVLALPFQG